MMKTGTAFAFVLLATVAQAQSTARTPTLRPTSADLSYAVYEANPTDPLRWFHGMTATQVQRAAVADGLAGIAVPRVIAFMRTLPGCQDDLDYAFSNFSYFTSKLDELYEAGRMRQGDWTIKTPWPYSIPWYIERRARDCATDTKDAPICGATITPAVADYIDVHIANGKCVQGSGLVIQPPLEVFSSARAALGTILTKVAIPKPDPIEAAALDAATAAHNALAPNTGALRMAAEDLADDEGEHRRFRLKDFMSDLDPAWSPAEVMALHRKQSASFAAWDANVKRADWFGLQMDSSDHQLWHICGALKDDRLLVRFSCPAGRGFTQPDGSASNMANCPAMTCAEALRQ